MESHLMLLKETLERLERGALTLKPEKCEFCVQETNILNHKVSHGRIERNVSKVKDIDKFKVPANKKEVQAFLGLVNYFRRFVWKFADIAKPLYELTGDAGKPEKFEWTPERHKAWEILKQKMGEQLALTHADPKKNFYIESDASDKAIAAVIYQIDENLDHEKTKQAREKGIIRPEEQIPLKTNRRIIEFFSLSLNESQRNWATTEKEAYAIYKALLNFKEMIGNQKVYIYTDATGVSSLKKTKFSNNKMERWRLELQEIDYEIFRITGKENLVADYLSRKVIHESEQE